MASKDEKRKDQRPALRMWKQAVGSSREDNVRRENGKRCPKCFCRTSIKWEIYWEYYPLDMRSCGRKEQAREELTPGAIRAISLPSSSPFLCLASTGRRISFRNRKASASRQRKRRQSGALWETLQHIPRYRLLTVRVPSRLPHPFLRISAFYRGENWTYGSNFFLLHGY